MRRYNNDVILDKNKELMRELEEIRVICLVFNS